MSRLDDRFRCLRDARRTGLVTYVTAGDPDLERSGEILIRLDRAGVDVLEVGVPFSDPVADGPVIQRATERALAAGATLPKVLDLVGEVRPEIKAPIVIFTGSMASSHSMSHPRNRSRFAALCAPRALIQFSC
jgi:tryptophan synthase alpha chain